MIKKIKIMNDKIIVIVIGIIVILLCIANLPNIIFGIIGFLSGLILFKANKNEVFFRFC